MITLGMITRNEEKLLPQCLASIRGWADEIIIVDDNSTDATRDIARKYGADVISNSTERDLSKRRNMYLRRARGEWIFVLDADERISRQDIPKIKELMKNKKAVAYGFAIRLYTTMFDLLNDWFICSGEYPQEESFSACRGYVNMYLGYRLFRNTGDLYYEGYIHETIERCIRKRGGPIVETDIPIHHFKNKKPQKFIKTSAEKYFRLELAKNAGLFKDHYRYYFRVGRDHLILKNDLNKSFAYLKKAIELKPDFPYSYFLLALVYKKKKMYDDAICVLTKALKIKDDYIGAHYLLGIIYDILGRPGSAEHEFTKALKISPFHPMVLNSLGVVLARQRKIKEARACFKRSLEVHPRFRIAQNNLKEMEALKC